MRQVFVRLRDRNPAVVEAWKEQFLGRYPVEITCGDIFGLGTAIDAIVSPANSYGFMDGGIDAIYAQRWPNLAADVRSVVSSMRGGIVPIGTAVGIKNVFGPLLILAPTMIVPEPIIGTTNVYHAFKSALLCASYYSERSILCPGFGTGVGGMPPRIAAYQMRMAYRHVFETPFDPGPDTLKPIALETALRTGGEIAAYEEFK